MFKAFSPKYFILRASWVETTRIHLIHDVFMYSSSYVRCKVFGFAAESVILCCCCYEVFCGIRVLHMNFWHSSGCPSKSFERRPHFHYGRAVVLLWYYIVLQCLKITHKSHFENVALKLTPMQKSEEILVLNLEVRHVWRCSTTVQCMRRQWSWKS